MSTSTSVPTPSSTHVSEYTSILMLLPMPGSVIPHPPAMVPHSTPEPTPVQLTKKPYATKIGSKMGTETTTTTTTAARATATATATTSASSSSSSS